MSGEVHTFERNVVAPYAPGLLTSPETSVSLKFFIPRSVLCNFLIVIPVCAAILEHVIEELWVFQTFPCLSGCQHCVLCRGGGDNTVWLLVMKGCRGEGVINAAFVSCRYNSSTEMHGTSTDSSVCCAPPIISKCRETQVSNQGAASWNLFFLSPRDTPPTV